MQQCGDLAQLLAAQFRRAAKQARLEADAIFRDALDAKHIQAAVARNVRGLGSPGRDRAHSGGDDQRHTFATAFIRITIRQQGRQTLRLFSSHSGLGGNKMYKAGVNARDLRMDSDQIGQELLGAERAQGVSTLKLSQMQGHEAACLCEGW